MSATSRPFHTLLVANRGEIAVRIMRTARRLGLATVAVYSEADRHSPHVSFADRAVCIGAAAPRDSYLNIPAIIEAARASGADAIHPGYGFLAENAGFAEAVAEAGLVFVGPPAGAIRAMGNKAEAKRLMLAADMPCVPGYQGAAQDDATLLAEAGTIGFPLMVKAAAGGGGRGMRLVREAAALPIALASARSEAAAAFGSDELILERAVIAPRHVEIQVFADTQGQVIHLGERDCSVQRRHQKVIEEAPSPAVSPALRARMGAAAVRAARSIGYVGAGTMEFLLDADGNFYFMEMNTRLQVEHAVTEAITGFDLVEWQLRVAAGEPLPVTQDQVKLDGHAIEVRLTAEDVPAGFLPQGGPLLRWRPPAAGRDVRVDHALEEGGTIPTHYDSMVAKLVAHGADREQARRKLLRAVEDCALLGVPSNQGFLADCLAHPAFAGNDVHTGFVDAHMQGALQAPLPPPHVMASAAMAASGLLGDSGKPATLARAAASVVLYAAGTAWEATLRVAVDGWQVMLRQRDDDQEAVACMLRVLRADGDSGTALVECDGVAHPLVFAGDKQTLHLFQAGRAWPFPLHDPRRRRDAGEADGVLQAPLTARIVAVHVGEGERVEAGQPLVVLEAMKMEHTIAAPFAGVVAELAARAGGQASAGSLLARVEAGVTAKEPA
ncbi:Acetyl-/propionyl-coenzyme A carboxylase alpha chain (Includes: Biotin carboxylase; Biotin carboxyl carrier protein) [Cupriavidus taiwanensis]|uniref:acetyl/propionyl/methylcrotonyl-CoA carboxylase subunit alpha n=1 Tax=Cupriavidus taiwanensis TaxID=164546 RepID=UPI000E12C5BF|nr:acetyl-CoA carboxylase biotin carboxylase subunit [Cupriavidus taiwanensis]SOY79479.1 Acetyl-/propionyl-coenzyme A carboxylase alpha chain (Includes: Biotin carboxylase; Biotin carboxyl carrier protein) [Cupriavidus taiwanensis]SOY81452.1 Acetyl-/propionyl-coenzyme A carboxylase alpha chain (Includes: Biotin carboxylase; Biotin carboxyl carrier protein) [Cupriavidus taiwanensis]